MTTVKRWAAASALAVLAGAASAQTRPESDGRAGLQSRITRLDARVAQALEERASRPAGPPDAASLRLSMAGRHVRLARRFLALDDERAARLHLDLAERLVPPPAPAEGRR